MSAIVLRVPKWKTASLAVIGAAFCIHAGLAVSGILHVTPKSMATGLAIAFLCLASSYVLAGTHLSVRNDGIAVKKRFSAPTYVQWCEVDEIGLATVPYWTKGREAYQYYVGIRLSAQSRRAYEKESVTNRQLCGYDVLLYDSYGMSLEAFIAFLRRVRDEARKG